MKFEAYLQSLHPELFKECANYLSHRGVMVHPKVFQKIGIMVFEGEQHPGYYTIIWPGVYHFGFNKGKNVAEVRFFKNGENTNINSHSLQAVAFAPKCWMDYTINMQMCSCADPIVSFHATMDAQVHFKLLLWCLEVMSKI